MTNPIMQPYGSWQSPITADVMLAKSNRLGGLMVEGETIYWLESRPSEQGRSVIVGRHADGRIEDLLPAPFNARTRVHEYGGASYAVHDGIIYFANFVDQRLYRLVPGSDPSPMTPEGRFRYAEPCFDSSRQRLICVREEHAGDGSEAVNTLVAISLDAVDDPGTVLAAGYDFFASARVSPDGRQMAWLCWNHPNMPWNGTELWVADVDEAGQLSNRRQIAGGVTESVFQPEWSPAGTLHFITDPDGWWNVYRWHNGVVEPLYQMTAEFGMPQWAFGMSTYCFAAEDELVCIYREQGNSQLARLNTTMRSLTPLETPYTTMGSPSMYGERILVMGGSATRALEVGLYNDLDGSLETLGQSAPLPVDRAYLSIAQPIEFPTTDDKTAHAFYYPPHNPDYAAPDGEVPPLLVFSHGGPTSATTSTLNLMIQFWTSRGFAVVDVNYGGSTGYGREYRDRLLGNWGIVDIDDCVNAARFLVEARLADENRLAIRGGSAGGYTTLGALTFRDYFKAGASYFGVSDLAALAEETHKFESRYLDTIVGPYPERADIYAERAPIKHAEQLTCPVIFFQGLEDKVVPPNQSELMYDVLNEKGVPTAYVAYEGEAHGFRKAENIKHSLENELYFYARVFEIALPEGSVANPIKIDNLD